MCQQSRSVDWHDVILRKLKAIIQISPDEEAAIRALPFTIREFKANQDIARPGDRPSVCSVLINGWACRYKVLETGKRQIIAFHLPGDMPDLESFFGQSLDHSIAGITPITVAFIQHRDLREFKRGFERIVTLLWKDTLIEAAISREWFFDIGRRAPRRRVAHLICELAKKVRNVGMNVGDTYPWPITQGEVADALVISKVHVGRILNDLREQGLADIGGGVLVIPELKGLMDLGRFRPFHLMGSGRRMRDDE